MFLAEAKPTKISVAHQNVRSVAGSFPSGWIPLPGQESSAEEGAARAQQGSEAGLPDLSRTGGNLPEESHFGSLPSLMADDG